MKIGQEVTHKKYGEAEILHVFTNESKLNKAVLLRLLTKEGKNQFQEDRNIGPILVKYTEDDLPRCYESNLDLVKI